MRNLSTGFFQELTKEAATGSSSSSSKAKAPEMPMSPVEAENQQLSAMLENLNLKMQIRQAGQALAAVQQQEEAAKAQMADQMAQQNAAASLPVVNASGNGKGPAPQPTPANPQEMMGR